MKTYMEYKRMYDFLSEVWCIYAKYVVTELTDFDWKSLQEDLEHMREKYQGYAFVVPVLIELLNEIERISRDK